LQRMATVKRRAGRRNRPGRRWRVLFLTLAVILLVPGILQAAIDAFVDERGVRHFTNVPGDPRYRLLVASPTNLVKKGGTDRFDAHIRKAAGMYRLDPLLIKAVVKVESNFDPKAVSPRGAMGLMQLMPETVRDLEVADPYDPEANILAGARYLRKNFDRFKGDLQLTLAAYNAGPDRVLRSGSIPGIPETIDYVKRVLTNYRQYKGISQGWTIRGKYAAD
jgi:soluble lytic murein transglycosylase-like protein